VTLQISQVFSQRFWPGVGDIDDCWVVATIQAVSACAPWLRQPGTRAFRAAAENPDKPGFSGGNLNQIIRASQTIWPTLPVTEARGWGWQRFKDALRKGRPAEVSINSAKLPVKLRFGYTGLHGVALVYRGGILYLANPLARPHSRWIPVTWAEMHDAVMNYGGGSVFAALYPTAADAFKTHPLYVPPPETDPDLDAALARIVELEAEVADLTAQLIAEQSEDAAVAAILIEQAANLTEAPGP